MWIEKIKINNFRNYSNQEIEFDKNINIFYGQNAQGKTNIIEAIFLCGIGKSFRTNKEKELIKINEKESNLEIFYKKINNDGNIKINLCDKKNIFINKIKIKKLSELLGKINIVIFTPDDINILKGSPSNRRRFLDIMISQLRPNYLHIYSQYTKTLEQRNSYLKNIKNEKNDFLDIWDEKLAEYGFEIYKYRDEFIKKIKSKIVDIHKKITGDKENIDIKYSSDCSNKENFLKKLKENKKIDIIKGYTTKGIHRDDFSIFINDLLVNVYGSQGQHRTAILSLKLSELKVINDEIGENPILLLDDFVSELDDKRINNFLENIEDTQVIITCTDKIDLNNKNAKVFKVENGEVI